MTVSDQTGIIFAGGSAGASSNVRRGVASFSDPQPVDRHAKHTATSNRLWQIERCCLCLRVVMMVIPG
jgi:hypothetical protein